MEYVTITQTELYVLAIHALEARIDSYMGKRTEANKEYIDALVAPLAKKQETIKHLYEVETGAKYEM